MPYEPIEKLRIWKEARELANLIHQLNSEVKFEFALKNQIDRSSQSVCDNIAEMYGAYYYKVKINALRISRKEAFETINHIDKFITRHLWALSACDSLTKRYQGLLKSINSYIKYLKEKDKISD
ncbi:MAG: four helix bundle protein [Parcubacteria group bacterium]